MRVVVCECPCSIVDWDKVRHVVARLLGQKGKVFIFTERKGIFFCRKSVGFIPSGFRHNQG